MKCRRAWRLLCLEERTVPAIATWDGGGISFNNVWTTAANWVNDIPPEPGDDLVFPAGAQQLTNLNDFAPGTTFHSITVTGLSYQIDGNPIYLTGDFMADFVNGPTANVDLTVNLDLRLTGTPLTFNIISQNDLGVGRLRTALFNGTLTGSGGIVKSGTGMLILNGGSTYTGVTNITDGVVRIGSNTALGAIGGGNGTVIADGATLDLAGDNLTVGEPISFAGRGVDRTNINGKIVSAGAISAVQGFSTLTGPLVLSSDALISGQFGDQNITITSGIREAGGSFKLEVGIVGLGLIFAPTAVNTFTGGTTATFNVQYDGQDFGAVTVTGGILSGKGTIGPLTCASEAYVNPSFGGLTTGDLNLSGNTSITLEAQDFGRIVAQGTVNLSGQLLAYTSVPVRPTAIYRIIDNDGIDPVVGTFLNLPEGSIVRGGALPVPLKISYHGGDGNDVILIGVSQTAYAVAVGPGREPLVEVYDGGGVFIHGFLAYPESFRGGVHVATADVTHDGVPDIITGAGPGGGPLVTVRDGVTFGLIRQFYAYDPNFSGGVFVAGADVFPDGHADIVTGAGPGGGPHVKVFDGVSGAERANFFAYDANFRGGVTIAAGPGGSGPGIYYTGNIITGAGPGGGPHVRSFNTAGQVNSEFFALDPDFRGGVSVAYNPGYLQNIDNAAIITAPMSNGVPVVQLHSYTGAPTLSFFAYDPSFQGGVNLAVLPLGTNGNYILFTGAGPGGGPHLREWEFDNGPVLRRERMAFVTDFMGGVFVG